MEVYVLVLFNDVTDNVIEQTMGVYFDALEAVEAGWALTTGKDKTQEWFEVQAWPVT